MGFCVNLLHEAESDHVARVEGQWLLGLREKEVGDWRLQIPSCAGSPTPEKVVETPKVKAKRGRFRLHNALMLKMALVYLSNGVETGCCI